MSRPRVGDMLLSTRMEHYEIEEVDAEEVYAVPMVGGRGRRARSFRIRDLEDVEVGVWQQVERSPRRGR